MASQGQVACAQIRAFTEVLNQDRYGNFRSVEGRYRNSSGCSPYGCTSKRADILRDCSCHHFVDVLASVPRPRVSLSPASGVVHSQPGICGRSFAGEGRCSVRTQIPGDRLIKAVQVESANQSHGRALPRAAVCRHPLIETQAERTPEKIAVVFENEGADQTKPGCLE
jgi:hypothetical protein